MFSHNKLQGDDNMADIITLDGLVSINSVNSPEKNVAGQTVSPVFNTVITNAISQEKGTEIAEENARNWEIERKLKQRRARLRLEEEREEIKHSADYVKAQQEMEQAHQKFEDENDPCLKIDTLIKQIDENF